MKWFRVLVIFCLFFSKTVIAEDIKAHVFTENFDGGIHVYANNSEFCPVSIFIDFELTNLESSAGNHQTFVIPAKSEKFFITDLKIQSTHSPFKMRYTTQAQFGNTNQTSYDKDFAYWLPYKKGSVYKIFQGYNGKETHQGLNALDFSLTEGTEVFAIRKGVVMKIVQNNTQHCPQPECARLNNYIIIYHDDGTFASYAHLQQNSVHLKEGDTVQQGQLICLSGNVGRTDGPHLHLEVFLHQMGKRNTLQTFFLTGNGEKKELLVQGKEYLRNY